MLCRTEFRRPSLSEWTAIAPIHGALDRAGGIDYRKKRPYVQRHHFAVTFALPPRSQINAATFLGRGRTQDESEPIRV
jgi:hypothetical protein